MSNRDETDRVPSHGGGQRHEIKNIVLNDSDNGDHAITKSASDIGLGEDDLNMSTLNIPKKQWVKFDDEDRTKINTNTQVEFESNDNVTTTAGSNVQKASDITTPTHQQSPKVTPRMSLEETAPAVLSTESVHINLENGTKATSPNQTPPQPQQQTVTTNSNQTTTGIQNNMSVINMAPKMDNTDTNPTLRTVELSTERIREGFANGDIIVTLLPINTKFPWITPAEFRPELVPEELMAQGLTLTVEEYVHAMETLVNDYRFTMYNICYKRVLVCWITFAFAVVLGLLFSGLQGIALFCLGVGWLFLNAVAIFFCMYIKLRLSRGLEKCMATVNKQLIKHKIILSLDDRGKMSCHKVNLCFIYFDPTQCIRFLDEFIERHEQSGTAIQPGWEARLDIPSNNIVIQGSNTTRVSRKQALAEEIYLRFLQRWGKDFLRRRLDWILEENIDTPPRHMQSSMCPCQYSEEIVLHKLEETYRPCVTLSSLF